MNEPTRYFRWHCAEEGDVEHIEGKWYPTPREDRDLVVREADYNAACGQIEYLERQNERLREALERIANPTAEGYWDRRPGSMDFISLAQAVLTELPTNAVSQQDSK